MKKLISALILLLSACHKDVSLDPDLDIVTWPYCKSLPEKEIALNRMVGNWKLIGSSCGECDDIFIKKAEDDVRLVITDKPHITY